MAGSARRWPVVLVLVRVLVAALLLALVACMLWMAVNRLEDADH